MTTPRENREALGIPEEPEANALKQKPGKPDCKIICDHRRHLVTLPYSRKNLNAAADYLGIKRAWLHNGNHFDIPKRMHEDQSVYKYVDKITTTKNIVLIIQGKLTEISQL